MVKKMGEGGSNDTIKIPSNFIHSFSCAPPVPVLGLSGPEPGVQVDDPNIHQKFGFEVKVTSDKKV